MKSKVLSNILAKQHETTLKRFLFKRAVYYFLPNVFFNFVIAYASFHEQGYTHFFAGPQSLARLILPMAIFLPVILTMDIIKRVINAADQGLIEFKIDSELHQRKFITKMCMLHGISIGLLVFILLLIGQFYLSSTYKLDGAAMAILDGILAGVFSILFTYCPVRKLRRFMYKRVAILSIVENQGSM